MGSLAADRGVEQTRELCHEPLDAAVVADGRATPSGQQQSAEALASRHLPGLPV